MARDTATITPDTLTALSAEIDRYGYPEATWTLTGHPEGVLVECANSTHLNRISEIVQQFGYGASWRGIPGGFVAVKLAPEPYSPLMAMIGQPGFGAWS